MFKTRHMKSPMSAIVLCSIQILAHLIKCLHCWNHKDQGSKTLRNKLSMIHNSLLTELGRKHMSYGYRGHVLGNNEML